MTIDLGAVEAATSKILSDGISVMNAFLLEDSERGHVDKLLALMAPPQGACVLDAGCGIGAVAKLMQEARPDLEFKLLNMSTAQLDLCPAGMERIHANYDSMPIADQSVDVVMFNFSICHSEDWLTTLREARRVLREGGALFLFDMARVSGDNALLSHALRASAYPVEQVCEVARQAGFVLDCVQEHAPVVNRLRDMMPGTFDVVVGEVVPTTWRFTRKTADDATASAIDRHSRIGFQFSGGRDSTAALYLLRPYWDRMTVYHLDTGDQFPETQEVVRRVAQDVPITVIKSDVHKYRKECGLASDLVPVDNSLLGRMVSGHSVKIVGRYECCYRVLMQPMHERMIDDGITLLIRGQRDDEYAAPPMRTGGVQDGMEMLYPIQDWTGDQVSAYLTENNLPLAHFYARGARRAPECMGCTAWWDEGRDDYLKEYHPLKFAEYRESMSVVRSEIDRQYGKLKGF